MSTALKTSTAKTTEPPMPVLGKRNRNGSQIKAGYAAPAPPAHRQGKHAVGAVRPVQLAPRRQLECPGLGLRLATTERVPPHQLRARDLLTRGQGLLQEVRLEHAAPMQPMSIDQAHLPVPGRRPPRLIAPSTARA